MSLYHKMWAGLNGFDPRNDLVLGSVRIVRQYSNITSIHLSLESPVALLESLVC